MGQKGCPASELIFFGRSVGSIFAIEAASRFPDAAGLVLESGIADVLERLLLRVQPEELGVTAQELAAVVEQALFGARHNGSADHGTDAGSDAPPVPDGKPVDDRLRRSALRGVL